MNKLLNNKELLMAAEKNMEQFTVVAHVYQEVLNIDKKLDKYRMNQGVTSFHEAEYSDFELSMMNRRNEKVGHLAKSLISLNQLYHKQTGKYVLEGNVTPFWKKKELFDEFDVFVSELTAESSKKQEKTSI